MCSFIFMVLFLFQLSRIAIIEEIILKKKLVILLIMLIVAVGLIRWFIGWKYRWLFNVVVVGVVIVMVMINYLRRRSSVDVVVILVLCLDRYFHHHLFLHSYLHKLTLLYRIILLTVNIILLLLLISTTFNLIAYVRLWWLWRFNSLSSLLIIITIAVGDDLFVFNYLVLKLNLSLLRSLLPI